MSRILKFVRAETESATHFGREFLVEFPDDINVSAAGAAPAGDLAEEPPPIDPDVLREEIIAAARADAEQMVREAYQEGFARGEEAGRNHFDATIAKSAEALTAAGAAVQAAQQQFLGNLEPQVLALVKLIATRVVGAESRVNPELITNTVRRALELLAGQYAITLLLHPDDLEAIRKHEIALLDETPGLESLQLTASPDVEPGGCIARSEFMEVDARLETLLEHVLDALTE